MDTVAAAPPDVTSAALLERYRQYCLVIRSVSEKKVLCWLSRLGHLSVFLGDPAGAAEVLAGLEAKTLHAFLVEYAGCHGPGSRRDMHAALRSFLRFAHEERLVPRDLSELVPTIRDPSPTRLPKALPESCICALERSIERSTPEGRRDAAMVCLLSTYGVRGAQVRRLCLEHIDWEHARIRFPACKKGRPVEQPLTARAGNRLADYITGGRPASCCREVFLDPLTGAALAHSCDLSRIISRRLEWAGVSVPDGVSRGTHGFRHAFATRLVGRVPFKTLADMLGHRSASSTLAYSRIDVQTLQQAALPWPGGGQ